MVLVREQYCLSNSDNKRVRIVMTDEAFIAREGREGVGLILFLFSVGR